jgi:ketosteroid isomerase-like protein
MSQENVETCLRSADAFNRRDVEAYLDNLDPEVELHLSLFAMLGGSSTVFRGHEGAREYLRDLDQTFAEFQLVEISEIRDLGERVFAVGRLQGRGLGSEAGVESPVAYVIELKNGRIIRLEDFFDPKEALEAAGLSE